MKYEFKNSDVYDVEACQPILEILNKYFLDIEFIDRFLRDSLNNKRGDLLDIALEINQLNNQITLTEIPQMEGVQEALDKLTIRPTK